MVITPRIPRLLDYAAAAGAAGIDRTPEFTVRERERIAAVAAGESLHLRLGDPLARLLEPLKVCLRLTEAQQLQHSLLRHLMVEMHETETVFWV